MSSKADFMDWKSHPITKQVFEGLREQESIVMETLAVSAGVDPLQDRYHAGYIAAIRDFYLIRLEDEDSK